MPGFAEDHFAMTHKEIGERLGITRQCVQMYERSALRKLRQRPHSLAVLIALGAELQRLRARRAPLTDR
jgi:DNA-directed RNA polymerase sigma subunit (sigma70/sigma32)